MDNARIAEAMRDHHEVLMADLQRLVDALGDQVSGGSGYADAVGDLTRFLHSELYPHARAEEDALYPMAARRDDLRVLVDTMIDEHRHLEGGAEQIAAAGDGARAVGAAQAVATVFRLHAAKENDYILATLAADPAVDLDAVIGRMHALLGAPKAPPEP